MQQCTISPHAKSKDNHTGAYWLTLPVDMEDFLDGKLELKIQKTSAPTSPSTASSSCPTTSE